MVPNKRHTRKNRTMARWKKLKLERLSKEIREIKEKLLAIKMLKIEDFIKGIVRIYPEEQSLICELFCKEQSLKYWKGENGTDTRADNDAH